MFRRSFMRTIVYITLCVLEIFSSSTIAAESPQSLANHRVWLQLIHASQTPVNSPDSDFYFTPDGFQSPEKELRATLEAFRADPELQCRFPARHLFLTRHLPNEVFETVHCNEYQQYLSSFSTDSLSLVYASGYLGNPASMFGHVFLKFNSDSKHNLLDNTFSYGAKVPDSDNKLTYIIKGIFGGYQGRFSNQKYHHHTLTYNESELRDLWEYKLNVKPSDIQMVLAHLWELNNTSMTYYFFRENCAYQLAKLLGLVFDNPLIAESKYWVMPVDLIMQLQQHQAHHPMYTEVLFHGSRQQSLYERWQQLSPIEQQALLTALTLQENNVDAFFNTLDEASAIRVIDTLYDYFAYQSIKQDGLSQDLTRLKREVMLKRFSLPPQTSSWHTTQPHPPHKAQRTSLFQFGFNHSRLANAMNFRFRANYYDLLTVNHGRIPFSELSTFDVTIQVSEENRFLIHEFILLNIVNLNASQTSLPGDNALAWKLSLGYRQLANSCVDCGSAYVEAFVGKAWALGSESVLYSAVSATANSSNDMGGNIASGVEMGGVIQFTSKLAMSVSLGYQWYINDLSVTRRYAELESRYYLSQQWDIRSTLRYDDKLETGIQISYYY